MFEDTKQADYKTPRTASIEAIHKLSPPNMRSFIQTLLFPMLAAALPAAANTACPAEPAAISDAHSFVQQSFDYLVIGE